jgi:hypothetical protein
MKKARFYRLTWNVPPEKSLPVIRLLAKNHLSYTCPNYSPKDFTCGPDQFQLELCNVTEEQRAFLEAQEGFVSLVEEE